MLGVLGCWLKQKDKPAVPLNHLLSSRGTFRRQRVLHVWCGGKLLAECSVESMAQFFDSVYELRSSR